MGKFKALNDKLDTLLECSKYSYSIEYSYEYVKALIETLTKEHGTRLDASTTTVENSEKIVHDMTETVDKLLSDVKVFMEDF